MNLKNKQKNKISDEWEVKKLEEISKIKMGQSPLSKFYNENDEGIPLVQGNADLINSETIERIFTTQDTKIAELGDIILTVRAPVGALGVVKQKKVCIGRGVCAIKNNNLSDQNFIYYFLDNFKDKWKKFEQGSTFSAVNSSDIRNLKILLPPLSEQKRIVGVLEVWDEGIKKLERKIKIKENIKKGIASQIMNCELSIVNGKKVFAPKLRLPGFSGKWEEKKLGDVCTRIKTGKLDVSAMTKNGKYRFYTCAKNYYKIDNFAFDTEALLVSGNGANVGYIHYFKGKFNAYQRTYVLDKFKSDIIFTKYILDKYLKQRIFEEKCDGNTPYIKMDTLTGMKIRLPKLKEQKAIAEVLTAADEEIEMLRKKLKILKDQKKFLLNNLVTGNIRIVND